MDEKEVSEMQEEMMTVLVVEPMKAPYVKNIPNAEAFNAQSSFQYLQCSFTARNPAHSPCVTIAPKIGSGSRRKLHLFVYCRVVKSTQRDYTRPTSH